MKILFVIHQLDYADHIAIPYLSAIAKELGHKTYFCVLKNNSFSFDMHYIHPDVVAYSANIWSIRPIINIHKTAKLSLNFVSIMGGPEVTVSPESFIESGMDAYCIGEGDLAFRDFLICVENGESFDDVPNLITKNKTNPIRPTIRHLDDLPPADRDLTIANSYLKDVPKKTFYTSRGCPFRCTYCCNSFYQELYKGKGPWVRRFSVERIIQEMERVKSKYRMDFVKIGDDLFAMKADDWLEEFVDKYKKRIGVPFNCYLRFDRADDDLLKLLKEAGCFSTHLSVDSTSEYIREKILKRNMREVDVIDSLKRIKSYGIHTWVNFITNIPESTTQDDLNAIEVCKKAKVTYPSYGTADPMKGTELYRYCAKKGYIDPAIYAGDMQGLFEESKLSCFSQKEKNISYNIHLLGSIVPKLPWPLYELGMWMIKHIPPNKLFEWIHDRYYKYSITKTIFKLGG